MDTAGDRAVVNRFRWLPHAVLRTRLEVRQMSSPVPLGALRMNGHGPSSCSLDATPTFCIVVSSSLDMHEFQESLHLPKETLSMIILQHLGQLKFPSTLNFALILFRA